MAYRWKDRSALVQYLREHARFIYKKPYTSDSLEETLTDLSRRTVHPLAPEAHAAIHLIDDQQWKQLLGDANKTGTFRECIFQQLDTPMKTFQHFLEQMGEEDEPQSEPQSDPPELTLIQGPKWIIMKKSRHVENPTTAHAHAERQGQEIKHHVYNDERKATDAAKELSQWNPVGFDVVKVPH